MWSAGCAFGNALRSVLVHDEQFKAAERDLAWTSLSRQKSDTTPPSDIEKLSLCSSEHPPLEHHGWWTCIDEGAITAGQGEHPIRLALVHTGRLLARMIGILFRAVRSSFIWGSAPASSTPMEATALPGKTDEPSPESSDDQLELID